jgi:hypothetical protein
MDDGPVGRRPAGGWPGSGAGLSARPPEPRRPGWRHARGRIREARRAAVLSVALATALLAACGGSGTPAVAKLSSYQKSLAYAQCMRTHGVPGFPDPLANGGFLINGKKMHLSRALMDSANKTCQHLLPNTGPMTAAKQRRVTAQALRFVACMRTHGIPAFPDPRINAKGVEFQFPRSVPPNSPLIRTAGQACQKLLPGGPP